VKSQLPVRVIFFIDSWRFLLYYKTGTITNCSFSNIVFPLLFLMGEIIAMPNARRTKMAKKRVIYRCLVCKNIVEVLRGGSGNLVCCGQSMQPMKENTTDAAVEKHVPIVEKTGGGFLVTVGGVLHPMNEDHFIEWIELSANGATYRRFLKPGDPPEAFFKVEAADVTVKAHCNLHGLWKG
jgi:superoxide reductase